MEDIEYMLEAKNAEKLSTCTKVHRGCVLKFTDDSYIQGANGTPKSLKQCTPCPRQNCLSGTHLELCRAVHAERQVILKAANRGFVTDEAILYSYMGVPCKDCLLELIEAGISEIVCIKETYYNNISKEILKEWIKNGGIFRILEV